MARGAQISDSRALDHPSSLKGTLTDLSLLCTKRPLSDRKQQTERGEERARDKQSDRESIAREAWEDGRGSTAQLWHSALQAVFMVIYFLNVFLSLCFLQLHRLERRLRGNIPCKHSRSITPKCLLRGVELWPKTIAAIEPAVIARIDCIKEVDLDTKSSLVGVLASVLGHHHPV